MLLNKYSLIFLLLLFQYRAHSQSSANFDELDEFLESDIQQIKEQDQVDVEQNFIDTLERLDERKYYKLPDPVVKKRKFSQAYKALLKKGAILVPIDESFGEQNFVNPKDRYVMAQEVYREGNYSYILDANNNKVFETKSINLKDITDDLILTPQVDPTIVYSKPDVKDTFNPVLNLNNSLKFSFESISVDSIESILNINNQGSIGANTISLTSYIESSLPLHFGLSLQLMNGALNDSSGEKALSIGSLSYGPSLKYRLNNKYSFILEYLHSGNFSLTTSSDLASGKTNSWKYGIEGIFDSFIGDISLGFFLQSSKFSIAEVTNAIDFNNIDYNIQRVIFTLGYNFDLEI